MVKLIRDKTERITKNLFVLEGAALAAEAAASDYEISAIYLTSKASNIYEQQLTTALAKAIEIYEITEDIAEKLTNQASSQGVFSVVKCKQPLTHDSIEGKTRVLLLSDISEPTNLGSVTRSAVAFGYDTLIVSQDSTDWLSNRAQRAAMGALLRADVIVSPLEDAIIHLKAAGFMVMAAAITDDACDVKDVIPANKTALIIGNETTGLDENTIQMSDMTVVITTDNRVQSLNAAVAASILMYNLK